MKTRPWLTISLGLLVWQLCAIATIILYGNVLVRPIGAAYAACFGNIQSNYGAFDRTMTYIGYLVVTTPATLAAIVFFDCLRKVRQPLKSRAIAFLGWVFTAWLALIVAYETGLSYKVNKLDWALFGPPANLYSFRNLMLHRIITWFLCTISMGVIALWTYAFMTMPRPAGFPVLPAKPE